MKKFQMITELTDMAGKTIKSITEASNTIYITFECGSRCIMEPCVSYSCAEFNLEDFPSSPDYNLKIAGWITEDEYEKWYIEHQEVLEKWSKETRKSQYEKLKAEFE